MSHSPKLTDDDDFTILVTVGGKMVRSWHYDNDDERRRYMKQAHEYCEGWYDCSRSAEPSVPWFHEEFERLRDQLSALLDKMDGKNA